MTSYDFKCYVCKHIFEIRYASRKDRRNIERCPECGERARRMFSALPIHFKDGG